MPFGSLERPSSGFLRYPFSDKLMIRAIQLFGIDTYTHNLYQTVGMCLAEDNGILMEVGRGVDN